MADLFIDTTSALSEFLDKLPELAAAKPKLFVDLEGNNLSRHGTLSLLTILVEPLHSTYLIDVHTLGNAAFTTSGKNNVDLNLKSILQSPDIPKVFFDIRNDSDALFSLHDISVAGIYDLQLMELAARGFSRRTVNGLAKCIQCDAGLSWSDSRIWNETKDQGKRLFAPEKGGSYDVFDQRPLPETMQKYCTQDVVYMPILYRKYLAKLCDTWWFKVMQETKARVRLSHSPSFNGKGRHMAEGPPQWQNWNPLVAERQITDVVRTMQQDDLAQQIVPLSFGPTNNARQVSDDECPSGSLTGGFTRPVKKSVIKIADGSEILRPVPAISTSVAENASRAIEKIDVEESFAKLTIDAAVGSDQGPSHDDIENDAGVFFHISSGESGCCNDDEAEDFAACGRDCDWCGHCMY